MKTTLVIIVALVSLCLPAIGISKTININTDQPYSNGSFMIAKNFTDTITFSSGISLKFFIGTISPPVPEYSKGYYGIIIDSSKGIITAGFKFDSSSKWLKNSDSLFYYSTRDTSWNLSTNFPHSLMHLDSLSNPMGKPISFHEGKWLFMDGFNTNGAGGTQIFAGKMINFNNIMYFRTMKNKMKVQVSNIFINDYPATPFPWSYKYVDSLCILYAVDSLGNGKFKETTGIAPSKPPAGKTKTPMPMRLKNGRDLNFLQTSRERISLFDIKGRQILGISHKSNAFPVGVLIYKIPGGNISTIGKVIVR